MENVQVIVDEEGGITLPPEILEEMDLEIGQVVQFKDCGGYIFMSKASSDDPPNG